MSDGASGSWRCIKSPTGHHKIVKYGIVDHCEHCGVVPRLISDDIGEPVTPTRAQRQATDPGFPKGVKPVRKMDGQKRTKRVRALAERDGWECFYCEHELVDPESPRSVGRFLATIDHLLPRVRGGSNAMENHVLACEDCNSRKSHGVTYLAEVIRRERNKARAAADSLERAQAFIDQLQWELFDAGHGEIPGRIDFAKGGGQRIPKTWKRSRPYIADAALFAELGERVCANIRAENVGGVHARTASVIKRGRKLAKRSASSMFLAATPERVPVLPKRFQPLPHVEPISTPIPDWC